MRLSLRIDEDGSSDEDEKEPVDEQDLPAPESPLPNVAPVSNILDFIVDAADHDSDESTTDAKKKSRKAISFQYLVPRHGSKPVHVNIVVARFYHFLQQDLYAQQSEVCAFHFDEKRPLPC